MRTRTTRPSRSAGSPRSTTRSTPSSRRRSAGKSRRSPSSSARWACAARPTPAPAAATTATPSRAAPVPAPPAGGAWSSRRSRSASAGATRSWSRSSRRASAPKGPTLSTYISIPGRYLVLMPGLNRVGVSRKIADEGQRRKLREIMNELNPPKGLGFIVRTAGLERTKRELARDLAYLLRLWKVILRRIKKAKAPAPIYQESDMITRTIRDIFTSEIDTIWIDEPAAFERAQEFLRVVMPKFVDRLKLYDEKVPLFHKYGIEDEIAKIQRRHVPLPRRGLDRHRPDRGPGGHRRQLGQLPVRERRRADGLRDEPPGRQGDRPAIAAPRPRRRDRQRLHRHARRAAPPRRREGAPRRHQARPGPLQGPFDERLRPHRDDPPADPAQPEAFGLRGLLRTARARGSSRRSRACPSTSCGSWPSPRTASDIRRVNVGVCGAVATYLNNRKRREIARLETEADLTIHIRPEDDAPAEHLQIECFDGNNSEIRLFPAPAPSHRRGR